MSRTGYDAFILEDVSQSPVWIEFTDQNIIFHDAADIRGKGTYETENSIKKVINAPKAAVLTIEPAGETCIPFAVVKNDYWRSAGRNRRGCRTGLEKSKRVRISRHQEESGGQA